MRMPHAVDESDGPNLTPVIDVVFLLLIFFLVATTYEQKERELDIYLPEVSQAQPLSMTQDLVINVTREGKFIVVKRQYSETELLALLEESHRNNPTQQAFIRGDGDAALRYAVTVMSLCNRAGMDYRIAALEEG